MKKILFLNLMLLLSAFSLYAQTKVEDREMPYIDSVHSFVDEMPVPLFSMKDYILQNKRYPDVAIKNNIEGGVIVRYTIDTNGVVINPVCFGKGAKGAPMLADEVIRLVNNMPKWKPGKYKGKPVKVYFYQQFIWRLS